MKVCYALTNGFSARMVLHSQLTPELNQRGVLTQILCEESTAESLQNFASESVQIHSAAYEKGKIRMSIGDARRYLREPIRNNAALWSRHQYFANGMAGRYAKYRAKFNYVLHRLFYRSRLAHWSFGKLDRYLHRSRAIREKLLELRPDVVVSTYPVSSFEVSFLLEAAKLGIPTVGHLLSWDNITCKGRFTVVPDYFVSWGPVMSQELKEHYDISPERIFECGVPHFDAHKNMVSSDRLQQIMRDLNLDPAKPYLFLGMSAPIFAPHEIDIVEWLAARIREDEFGKDMQLVVRPHPQNVTGNMADESWLPRLKNISGDRVALNLPKITSGGLAWDMEVDDLGVLVNLLAGCSVSMNSGSTLSIDALAHNKPVVLTMFDADKTDLPWWKSAARIRQYPHYEKLIGLGGVSVVGSYSEMTQTIQNYLADDRHLLDDRKQTLAMECLQIDGDSSRRIAEVFASQAFQATSS